VERLDRDRARAAHRIDERVAPRIEPAQHQQHGGQVLAQRRVARLAPPAAVRQRAAAEVDRDHELAAVVEPRHPARRRPVRRDVQPRPAPGGRVDQRVLDRADDLALARGELLDAAHLDRDPVAVAPQPAPVAGDVGAQLVVQRLEPPRARAVDVPQHAGRRAEVRHGGPREVRLERVDQLAEPLLARRLGAAAERALRDPHQLGRHDHVGLRRADHAELVDDHGCPLSVASRPASAKNRRWR
jgi:hypothetical protein